MLTNNWVVLALDHFLSQGARVLFGYIIVASVRCAYQFDLNAGRLCHLLNSKKMFVLAATSDIHERAKYSWAAICQELFADLPYFLKKMGQFQKANTQVTNYVALMVVKFV